MLPRASAVAILFALALPVPRTVGVADPEFLTHPYQLLGVDEALTASVSVADFNGDGATDLLVANGRHWADANQLFLNNGQGRFLRSIEPAEGEATTYGFAVADFDGDGDVDAVEATDRAGAWLYRNDGTGHFTTENTGAGIPGSRAALALDVDNDGDMDAVLSNRGQPATLLVNDGRGHFSVRRIDTGADGSVGIASADLNADGAIDLVFAVRDGESAFALLNDGRGGFSERLAFGLSNIDVRSVSTGDLDGDGHPDIVLGVIGGPMHLLFVSRTGAIARRDTLGPNMASAGVALADFDGDGDLDLVVARSEAANAVYFNEGNGRQFREVALIEVPAVREADTYGVSVGDFNSDGAPDFVFANSGAPNPYYITRRAR